MSSRSHIHRDRIFVLKDGEPGPGPVLYWMSRDQRCRDNWALLYAQELALLYRRALAVVFCLVPDFLGATIRHYGFMLKGLEETADALERKNIRFILLTGNPHEEIPAFVATERAGVLVTDFDPLRIKRKWKDGVARRIAVPFHEVDAHNIVPCRVASPKQEYAAATFRPKIRRVIEDYLDEFPKLKKHPVSWKGRRANISWKRALRGLKADRSVSEVDWFAPGERSAAKALRSFLRKGLVHYDADRNDPVADGQSGLSPYLHFGQIAAHRVVLETMNAAKRGGAADAFLEELVVRRELSDNFCFYNERYDSFEGFPAWAQKTLDAHRNDRREYRYSPEQFEHADTHDPLWNAAQREMVKRGKMHGYMRMYWAKKILEWTGSPEEAIETAIYLNDRYEFDGRDPNGYAGIAWSIGGVHDRAWGERPIFGKIRYMSYNGCKSKFNVRAYIERHTG